MNPGSHPSSPLTHPPEPAINPSPGRNTSEIVSTRCFDAPRAKLFTAFENPEQLARWWGPKGFTNRIDEFDLRPGGVWRLVMHGPDGTEYKMTKTFLEVQEPEKIVLEHPDPTHRFVMTMQYTVRTPATTELTWRMKFEITPTEAVRQIIVDSNEQNFDRLAAHLLQSSI